LSTRPDSEDPLGIRRQVFAEGRFGTPWGEGAVTVWRGRLVGVDLPPVRADLCGERETATAAADKAAVRHWVAELEAYFRGERLSWHPSELELDQLAMTPFARKTVHALLGVPAGCTVSYGELAEMAGYPRAARAVGTVMAGNPVPIVVPCHRVIRSDGSLGRYGTDSSWKERLLTHERSNAGGR
jgi:O-6-methylguanine DNA methyltransferase